MTLFRASSEMGAVVAGVLSRVGVYARRFAAGVSGLQGVAGAGLVTCGVVVLAGAGWALVTAGAFLLLGAWGSR